MARFTALDQLNDRSKTATAAANRIRDKAETRAERDAHDHKSYQDGCFSIDDFGIIL